MDSLTGQQLLGKDEKVVGADSVLADKKIIAFYFSAHWCPPCKAYTPELSQAYTASQKKDEVAIVFVSSDRDEASFNSYYSEMPFCALPYAARDKAAALGNKCVASCVHPAP